MRFCWFLFSHELFHFMFYANFASAMQLTQNILHIHINAYHIYVHVHAHIYILLYFFHDIFSTFFVSDYCAIIHWNLCIANAIRLTENNYKIMHKCNISQKNQQQ